ncbi:hypothetical protein E3N88_36604 [Mikania micrantha]|uniref:Uncharacterized protein n=1 Tax=Mikania micrantha TaxID=192012 RepID=A0A5N6M449_9ASTR|nr:hypothetical protein E3N88_36604 [Mikania micrantha]
MRTIDRRGLKIVVVLRPWLIDRIARRPVNGEDEGDTSENLVEMRTPFRVVLRDSTAVEVATEKTAADDDIRKGSDQRKTVWGSSKSCGGCSLLASADPTNYTTSPR